MTRYNTPPPHNQVPHSQERPAAPGQQHASHAGHDYQQPHWPPQQHAPHGGANGYINPGYPGEAKPAAQPDPYAALRPDGYGFDQAPQSSVAIAPSPQ